MSPGRLDGLYVVVVDEGGASARVRSIDPGVRTFPVWGAALSSTHGPEPLPAQVGLSWGIVWARGYREPSSQILRSATPRIALIDINNREAKRAVRRVLLDSPNRVFLASGKREPPRVTQQ